MSTSVPGWGLSTLRPRLGLTTDAPPDAVLAAAAAALRQRRFSVEGAPGAAVLVGRRTQWSTLLTLGLPGPVVVRAQATSGTGGTSVYLTVARGQHELRAERLVRDVVDDLVARLQDGGATVALGTWASTPRST
ncbi:hypothetical protein GC089_03380 [Cellulomonas sp. JZ18]|uniref:hypothetical protein n=1 Tax=Cellulomonas sp. JZ18 TaxID=2654191 RepID=UPI0012D385F7|nr:hypothetical protein [Cellulomonas sp. JZ18]QGQ18470.1 hypothetical protein GC089_03380 [Cellulomonas sp. JZ18]